MRGTGAERPVRAMKSRKLDGAKGSRHPACPDGQPREREEPSSHAKPFRISKWVVWEAYTRVKANHGAAGVDAESVEMFEQDLKNNLYKIWSIRLAGDSSTNAGINSRNGLGTLEVPNGNGAVSCIGSIGASPLRVTIPAWVGRS